MSNRTPTHDELMPDPTLDDGVVVSLQHRLDGLFERRDDLEGVSAMADLLHQAATWSA